MRSCTRYQPVSPLSKLCVAEDDAFSAAIPRSLEVKDTLDDSIALRGAAIQVPNQSTCLKSDERRPACALTGSEIGELRLLASRSRARKRLFVTQLVTLN